MPLSFSFFLFHSQFFNFPISFSQARLDVNKYQRILQVEGEKERRLVREKKYIERSFPSFLFLSLSLACRRNRNSTVISPTPLENGFGETALALSTESRPPIRYVVSSSSCLHLSLFLRYFFLVPFYFFRIPSAETCILPFLIRVFFCLDSRVSFSSFFSCSFCLNLFWDFN